MATVTNEDVLIGVCENAHTPIQWVLPFFEKQRERCGECGMPYFTECRGVSCVDRPFHPNDYHTNYHKCGEPIPWARAREQIVWLGYPWRSDIVGQPMPNKPPAKGQPRAKISQPDAVKQLDVAVEPTGSRVRWAFFFRPIGRFLFGGLQNTFGTVVGAIILALLVAYRCVNISQGP